MAINLNSRQEPLRAKYGVASDINKTFENSRNDDYARASEQFINFGPTIGGAVYDPSRMQRTWQSDGTNWWNDLRNSIGEIRQGSDPDYDLMHVNHKIDRLQMGEDVGFSLEQLEDEKQKILIEKQEYETARANRPVDPLWKAEQQMFSSDEWTNPVDYLSYEFPKDIAGSLTTLYNQFYSIAATSMLPKAGAAVGTAIAPGPGTVIGATAGFIGAIGSSIFFQNENRKMETRAEASEAYNRKVEQEATKYLADNPDQQFVPEDIMRNIRINAMKGIKQLEDKNMSLLAGDVFDTVLATLPWYKGFGAAIGISRAGRNAMRLGSIANTSISEGTEEGRQFLFTQNYLKDIDINDDSRWGNYKQALTTDLLSTIDAMSGNGDANLYNNPEFRNAVHSGMATGGGMSTVMQSGSLISDHIAYNKTKASLSTQAALNSEKDFTRFRADILDKLFSENKTHFIYDVLKVLGTTEANGFTSEDAKKEAETIKELYKDWKEIQNPTQGPLKHLWNSLTAQAKSKTELGELAMLKKQAFIDTVAYKTEQEKIKGFEALKTEENLDDYGFIKETSKDVASKVSENFDKLGLINKDVSDKLGKDRIDSLIDATENRIKKLTESIEDTLSGKKLVERRLLSSEFQKAISESKNGNIVPKTSLKYVQDDKEHMLRVQEYDDLVAAINKSDDQRIKKRLNAGENPGELAASILAVEGMPISSETYSEFNKVIPAITNQIAEAEAEMSALEFKLGDYFEGELELTADQLKEIDNRTEELRAIINNSNKIKDDISALDSRVKNEFEPIIRSEEEYKKLFFDKQFNETSRLERLFNESEANTPINEAKANLEYLEALKTAFPYIEDTYGYNNLDSFKEAKNTLKKETERAKELVDAIEKRIGDRNSKNAIVLEEAFETSSQALDAKFIVNGANQEVTIEFNSVPGSVGSIIKSILGTKIDVISRLATDEYKRTGKLNQLYPELLLQLLAESTNLGDLKKSIQSVKDKIISAYPKDFVRILTSYANNPEKLAHTIIASSAPASDLTDRALKEYLRTRSLKLLSSIITGTPVNTEGMQVFIETHKVLKGIHKLEQVLSTKTSYANMVVSEHNAVKNNALGNKAPSAQQIIALREVVQWINTQATGVKYEDIGYLSGAAGTGKTFLAGLVSTFSGINKSSTMIAAHSSYSLNELSATTGIIPSGDLYKTVDNTVDHLARLLKAKSPLLKNIRLVILDEIGYLNNARLSELALSLSEYNNSVSSTERIKIFATGDENQIRESLEDTPILSWNDLETVKLKVFNPLSIVYRTGISDITATANLYLDKVNIVKSLKTRINSNHTAGVNVSQDEAAMVAEIRQKNASGLLQNKSVAVLVSDESEVTRLAESLQGVKIEILPYQHAQGRTLDEVYINLRPVGDLTNTSRYNSAMYMAITRATSYVYILDRKLTSVTKPLINDSLDKKKEDDTQEFKQNYEDYKTKLESDVDVINKLNIKSSVIVIPTGIVSTPPEGATVQQPEVIKEVPKESPKETKSEPIATVKTPIETVEEYDEDVEEDVYYTPSDDINKPTDEDTEGVMDEDLDDQRDRKDSMGNIDINIPDVNDDPNVWELHYPQSIPSSPIIQKNKDGFDVVVDRIPELNAGDEVFFVKAIIDGQTQIRVVKPTFDSSGNYITVAVIGTDKQELKKFKEKFPKYGKIIEDALSNNVRPTEFNRVPGSRALIRKAFGLAKLKTILRAKLKHYNPLQVLYNDSESYYVDEALKNKIINETRDKLIKNGMRAETITVNAIAYTATDKKVYAGTEIKTVSVNDVPKHQSWVKPGRAYLRVTATLVNGSKIVYHITAQPITIAEDIIRNPSNHALSEFMRFADVVNEIENLYDKAFTSYPVKWGNTDTVFIKGEKEEVTSNELFFKSITWYPNSLSEESSTSLMYSGNDKERIFEDTVKANLTQEEYTKLLDLRREAHNLSGINFYKDRIPKDILDNLTEEDLVPKSVDSVTTNYTNVTKIGEIKTGGWDVYVNKDGKEPVAVKYMKYKGVYFKLKAPVRVIDGGGFAFLYDKQNNKKITLNIQRSLDTNDPNFSLRKRFPYLKIADPITMHSFTEGEWINFFEQVLSKTRKRAGILHGSGGAQNNINALAKINKYVGEPTEISFIRRTVVKTNKSGDERRGVTGYSIKGKFAKYFSGLAGLLKGNVDLGLLKPIKLTEPNSAGDYININDIYTNFKGVNSTTAIIEDISEINEAQPTKREPTKYIQGSSIEPVEKIEDKPTKPEDAPTPSLEDNTESKPEDQTGSDDLFGALGDSIDLDEPEGKPLLKTIDSRLGRSITQNEAINRIRGIIKDIKDDEVQFVDEIQMMRLTGGKKVWGYFKQGVIYALKNTDGTVYENILRHEAFHRVFNMNMFATEREFYLDLVEELDPSLKGKNIETKEEWLAVKFQEYVRYSKTKYYKLIKLFKRVLAYFNFINNHQLVLDQFFEDIDNGRYTNTVNYGFGAERAMVNIEERFDTVDNYLASKAILLKYINKLTTQFKKKDRQGNDIILPVRIVDYKAGKLNNIPFSRKEAVLEFKSFAKNILNTPDDILYEKKAGNLVKEKKYLTLLLDQTRKINGIDNIDAIMASVFRQEETAYEEYSAANLDKEIRSKEEEDQQKKVTDSLKDFIGGIYVSGDHFMDWSFGYVKLLELFTGLDSSDANFLSQLEYRLSENDPTHPLIAALWRELTDLRNMTGISIYPKYNKENNNYEEADLPTDMYFNTDGEFFYSPDRPPIRRESNETTGQFIVRIREVTKLDLNAINVLMRKHISTNLWNEIVSHFSSQREKAPYAGTFSTKEEFEMGVSMGRQLNIRPYVPDTHSVKTALKGDIKFGIIDLFNEDIVSDNKVLTDSLVNTFMRSVERSNTVDEKQSILKRFFEIFKVTNINGLAQSVKLLNTTVNDVVYLLRTIVNARKEANSGKDVDIASILDGEARNIMARLSDILSKNNRNIAPVSFMRRDGKKIFKYVQYSGGTRLINNIFNYFDIQNSTLEKRIKNLFSLPAFVKSEGLKTNRYEDIIYINGVNKINSPVMDFDQIENKGVSYLKPKEYKKEDEYDILFRKFNLQFVAELSKKTEESNKFSYIQSTYVVSNKPTALAVLTDLLTISNDGKGSLREAVKHGLLYELKRRAYHKELLSKGIKVKHLDKNVDYSYFILGRKFTEKDRLTDIEDLVVEAINKLEDMAMESYMRNKALIDSPDKIQATATSLYETLNKRNRIFKPKRYTSGEITPNGYLYLTYFVNNYINGFHLGQLYIGDQAFTKSKDGVPAWDDIIKRMQSVFSMGKSPAIGPTGVTNEFKIAVVNDPILKISDMTDYSGEFKRLYGTNSEVTDGQMYLLPGFAKEYKKALGRNEQIGEVLKPIYFNIDKYGVPRLIKCSALELTDELVKNYPELKLIRRKMEEAGVQGYVFQSAMKVGQPAILSEYGKDVNTESIVTLNSVDFRSQFNPASKIDGKISNFSQLLYALNVNGLNTEITDKIYKANSYIIERQIDDIINKLYANGSLSEEKLKDLIKKTLVNESGNVTEGSERIYELLNDKQNLSVNLPTIIKKVIVQLGSQFSNKVNTIDFSGGKLILTSAAPFKLYRGIDGTLRNFGELSDLEKTRAENFYKEHIVPLHLRDILIKAQEATDYTVIEDNADKREVIIAKFEDYVNKNPDLTQEDIKFIKDFREGLKQDILVPSRLRRVKGSTSTDNYAEVLMPRLKVLAIAKRLGLTEDELRTTFIGVRIPTSGMNSAIPIRIVGYIPDNINLIVAPEEIVPLHGSDFDVDSLFVIGREVVEEEDGNTKRTGRIYIDDAKNADLHTQFIESTRRIRAKYGVEFDRNRAIKEFAAKYKIVYREEDDRFLYFKPSKKKSTITAIRGALRPVSQTEIDRLTLELEAYLKEKEAVFGEGFDKEVAMKSFMYANGIEYDFNRNQFTFIRPIIAIEGDIVGYVDNKLDPDFVKKMEYEKDRLNRYIVSEHTDAEEIINLKRTIKLINKLLIKYHKNVVIQGYLDIVTSDVNKNDVLRNISMSVFKDYVYEKLERATGIHNLLNTYDINNADHQTNIQLANMLSVDQVGIIANTMKTLSYMLSSATNKGKEVNIEYEFRGSTKHIVLNGTVLSTIQKQREVVDQNDYSVWELFDSLLNAAVDNVKEQILATINLNSTTSNAFTLMVGTGGDIASIVLLMNNPIIKQFSNLLDTKAKAKIRELREQLKESLKKLIPEGEIKEFMEESIYNYLTEDKLSLNISKEYSESSLNDVNFVKTQLAVLHAFEYFKGLGDHAFDASRGLSTLREESITYNGMIDAKENLEKTYSKDFPFKNANLLSYIDKESNKLIIGVPHIDSVYKANNTLINIINDFSYTHGSIIDTFIEHVLERLPNFKIGYENVQADKEDIRTSLMHFMLSSYPDYVNNPNDIYAYKNSKDEDNYLVGNEAWVQNFCNEVKQAKLSMSNSFLEFLNIEPLKGYRGINHITYKAGSNASDSQRIILSNSFSKLPENLKHGFLKYAVLIQGLKFGATGFSNYMDGTTIKPISNYIQKDISNMLNDDQILSNILDRFALQLAFHYPDSTHRVYKNISNLKEDKKAQHKYNIVDNPDKNDSTYAFTLTSANKNDTGLVVHMRGSSDNKITVFLRTKLEENVNFKEIVDNEGKKSTHKTTEYKATYRRIDSISNTDDFEDFTDNLYYNTQDTLDGNWTVDQLNPKHEVIIARPGIPAIGNENGENRFVLNRSGSWASKKDYNLHQIVLLRDKYDIMYDHLYPYEVIEKIHDKVSDSDLYKLKRIANIEHFENVDSSAEGQFLDDDQTRELFETLANTFRKQGVEVELRTVDADPNEFEARLVVVAKDNTTGVLDFAIEYNKNVRMRTEHLTHEFAHIFTYSMLDTPEYAKLVDYCKKAAPKLVEILAKSSYYGTSKAKQEGELIARLIGKEAMKYVENKSTLQRIIYLFKAVIQKYLKMFIPVKYRNPVQVAAYDMLKGNFTAPTKFVSKEMAFKKAENKPINDILDNASKNWTVSNDQKNYVNTNIPSLKLDRVNDFLDKSLSPYDTTKEYFEVQADREFAKLDKATAKKKITVAKNDIREFTYDEYKAYLEKRANTERVKGKIIHKYIEFKGSNDLKILEEVNELAKEKPNQDEIDTNVLFDLVKKAYPAVVRELGIDLSKNSKTEDDIRNEAFVYNSELGVGGTADMLIKHFDGSYSLVDYKTGNSIVNIPMNIKFMKHSSQFGGIEWTTMNKAKLQLLMYAVLLKSMDRNATFRDLRIVHLSNNQDAQLIYDVDTTELLAVLEEHFKDNNPEWYALNKDIFNPAHYSSLSSSTMKAKVKSDLNDQDFLDQSITMMRQNYIKSRKLNISDGERYQHEKKAQEHALKALEIQNDNQAFKNPKDMSVLRRWFDNLYNVKDPMMQAFSRFWNGRHNQLHLDFENHRQKHDELLQKVLEEYYAEYGYSKLLKNISFNLLNSLNENDAYGFLYHQTPEGIRFRLDKGTMTDAQWEYSKYLRTTMRNQYYLTANPYKLIGILEQEKKDLSMSIDEIALADYYIGLAKQLPNVNKEIEHSKNGFSAFEYTLDFIPKVPAAKTEMSTKALKRWATTKFTEEVKTQGLIQKGLPFKYVNDFGVGDEFISSNPSVIFSNFTSSIMAKRYFDDVYAMGNTLIGYFEAHKDVSLKPDMQNTAAFLRTQLKGQLLNETSDPKWLTRDIVIGNRRFSISQTLATLRTYFSWALIALRWKAGVANGIMESLFNHKKGISDSISKSLKIDKRFIDFTENDLLKAHVIYFDFQKAKIAGKAREHKLFNALKKLDYQTDNHIYAVDKSQLLGVPNPALQASTLFAAHSIFEQHANATVLIAQLLRSGMWDKYDNKFNYIGETRGVDIHGNPIKGLTSEEITKLKKVSEAIHGSYRKIERNALEFSSFGALIMQFKRYLPNALHQAWASKYNTFALGQYINTGKFQKTTDENGKEVDVPIFEWEKRVHEGVSRSMLRGILLGSLMLKEFFIQSKDGIKAKDKFNALAPEQKMNIVNGLVQAAFFAALWALVDIMFEDTDDDDEWKKRFTRMRGDMIQGWNVMDLVRAGVNPSVTIPRIYQILKSSEDYMNAVVSGETITKGKNKGKYAGQTKLEENIPFLSQYDYLFNDTLLDRRP